ncbi:MAG: hypothetical protein K6E79_04870 [Pseudobutyrivibrio sp.]|nr:hypothetical protein [Pseudobutyrivibrio sp.]
MRKELSLVVVLAMALSLFTGCAETSTDKAGEDVGTKPTIENGIIEDEDSEESDETEVVEKNDSWLLLQDGSENDIAPSLDISDCDTFTQIVDKKLEPGMGYANVNIDGTDVLLVCSGTFDNGDGTLAAIDATVYAYIDTIPTEIGKVASGGTAYPLAMKDGKLYTGSNNFVCKNTVKDNKVTYSEAAWVTYAEGTGDESYYYDSAETGEHGLQEDSTKLDEFYDEILEADVINFIVETPAEE